MRKTKRNENGKETRDGGIYEHEHGTFFGTVYEKFLCVKIDDFRVCWLTAEREYSSTHNHHNIMCRYLHRIELCMS
jgi:hypothetical protein